jgi:hypothetical protein
MEFTRIRKVTLLFELPFCSQALGKILFFAMWPLGRPAGAAGAIPGELVAGLAGEGRWKGLWVARVRFGARSVGERRRWAGTPAARGGGRRGCRFPVREARGEGVERFGSFLRG